MAAGSDPAAWMAVPAVELVAAGLVAPAIPEAAAVRRPAERQEPRALTEPKVAAPVAAVVTVHRVMAATAAHLLLLLQAEDTLLVAEVGLQQGAMAVVGFA